VNLRDTKGANTDTDTESHNNFYTIPETGVLPNTKTSITKTDINTDTNSYSYFNTDEIARKR